MPFIFNSVFPDWVVWVLTVESAVVGIAAVVMWARSPSLSFKLMLAGWFGATMVLFGFTLVVIYIVWPIVAVMVITLVGVLIVAAVASIFRRKSAP